MCLQMKQTILQNTNTNVELKRKRKQTSNQTKICLRNVFVAYLFGSAVTEVGLL